MQPVYKLVEHVPWYRHVIRYTLATGERRRMVRWSSGAPWVYEEIGRELIARFGDTGIRPGSVTVQMTTA